MSSVLAFYDIEILLKEIFYSFDPIHIMWISFVFMTFKYKTKVLFYELRKSQSINGNAMVFD